MEMKWYVLKAEGKPTLFIKAESQGHAISRYNKGIRKEDFDKILQTLSCEEVTSLDQVMPTDYEEFKIDTDASF